MISRKAHLNGTGQASLGDVVLMPVVESAVKRDETATLGHYAVSFAGGTKVEIAALFDVLPVGYVPYGASAL